MWPLTNEIHRRESLSKIQITKKHKILITHKLHKTVKKTLRLTVNSQRYRYYKDNNEQQYLQSQLRKHDFEVRVVILPQMSV